MKRKIYLLFIILIILGMGCRRIEKNEEQSFVPPSVIKQPRLFYPKIAQEKAIWGSTKLILSITKTGEVENVYVVKSSGHDILDSAAIEYCKSLVFNPALRNGKPVNSRIEWVMKFNITDQNWKVESYLQELAELFKRVQYYESTDRIEIEDEILKKHNEFIQNYGDALNFNIILKQVILPEISREWQNDWDGWPLSFLLYHDFIKRFQDYDSLPKVKTLLISSLKLDIQYIKNTPATDMRSQQEKDKILNKIKIFVANNYPDIILPKGMDS